MLQPHRHEIAQPIIRRPRTCGLVWTSLLACCLLATPGLTQELRGGLTVVGQGPERAVIEQLALAFEQAHLGTAVEMQWNHNLRLAEMVRSGAADLAVGGREEADLTTTTIAWDGLAVIVNFSNPIKELAKQQVASIFKGTIRDWGELDERATGKIYVVLRPDDQQLSAGFEQSLGIVGAATTKAKHIRSDQGVLSRVSGQLDAVSYLSMNAALDAVRFGMSVRTLVIDGVEPGTPTVRSGKYPLKRPVVLLEPKAPTALAQAFVKFALSPAGQRILSELYIPLAP